MTRRIAARVFALGLGFLCPLGNAAAAPRSVAAFGPIGDGIALTAGIGAALAAELLIDPPAAQLERPDPASIPAVDAIAPLGYDRGLDAASEALQYGAMLWPACFALIGERDELLGAAAACAESMAWTYAAKEAAKALFPRTRPYAYAEGDLPDDLAEEARESFPSGHAALAFSAATCFAVLALETAPDDPATPWLVGGGFAAATGVAALRVASGCHFVTDVAAGAALGSLIGWAVASLHARDAAGALSASVSCGPSIVLRLSLD
jgi:membrane-associated phospholipid phosphatase